MSKPDVLLLCATEGEARLIAAALVGPRTAVQAGKTIVSGTIEGAPCRLAYGGIGPVNAAHALTCQVERQRPSLVLQFGIAGAYVPAGLPVGAVALATEEIYGDLGVISPDGWQPAEAIGIPLALGPPPRFNRFPLDPHLVEKARQVCNGHGAGGAVMSGPFLTRSQVTGLRALGDELHARFGALCESMEGAAAAHVCALYDVPFLEVRGVSNLVEDRDRSRWDIPGGAAAAQQAALRLVRSLDAILEPQMNPAAPLRARADEPNH